MILVDMNQISLASMMMHLHMSKSKETPDIIGGVTIFQNINLEDVKVEKNLHMIGMQFFFVSIK